MATMIAQTLAHHTGPYTTKKNKNKHIGNGHNDIADTLLHAQAQTQTNIIQQWPQ
jgi:hypothetical protein